MRAGDPQLETYAKGCLANMRQTILVAATKRQLEAQTKQAAALAIQSSARRLQAKKMTEELRRKEEAELSEARRGLLASPL